MHLKKGNKRIFLVVPKNLKIIIKKLIKSCNVFQNKILSNY